MSVPKLIEILDIIKLDKKKKIPLKYSKGIKKRRTCKNKKYLSYSGGSYPGIMETNISNEKIKVRIQTIKNSLSDMKNSVPKLEIGIFNDIQIHPEDLQHAKYEMLQLQERQQNIKETFSESFIRSKFPIYCRIICAMIKLIVCCLSCKQEILWTILYQWSN